MAKGFKKGVGGANPLNFKVVGGTSAPANPSQNTIWINTEEMAGWYFQSTQPENMAEDEVWFSTGTESPVAFNALKKNSIMVYPLSAKQYVSGTLVDVEAKSYQGGAWVDWWSGQLYENGNEYEQFTGGISVANATKTGDAQGATVKKESNRINFECYIGSLLVDRYVTWYANNPIDLTPYKTLKVVADTQAVDGNSGTIKPCITKTITQLSKPSSGNMSAILGTASNTIGSNIEYLYDISTCNEKFYVGVYIYNRKGNGYKLILE